MKKNLFGGLLLAITLFACSDDEKDDIRPEQEVKIESILCNNEAIKPTIDVNAESKLIFDVKISATQNDETTICWILDNDTLASNTVGEFTLEGRSGNLEVALIKKGKVIDAKTINLVGPYKHGAFIYGASEYRYPEYSQEHPRIAFINEDPKLNMGKLPEPNLFIENNPTKEYEYIHDAKIINNKLYLVQKSKVEVADAQTLKSIHTIDIKEIIAMSAIDNNTLIFKDKDDNIYPYLISEGSARPALQPSISPSSVELLMLSFNGYTAVGSTNGISFIENTSFTVKSSIDFTEIFKEETHEYDVTSIVKGNDGYIYAFIRNNNYIGSDYLNQDSKTDKLYPAKFVKIDPKTLEVVNKTGLDIAILGEEDVNFDYYTAIDKKKDVFYFVGYNEDNGINEIYRIDYNGNYKLLKVIEATDAKSEIYVSGYMAVSGDKLYIPLYDEYRKNFTTKVLDINKNEFIDYSYTTFIEESKANMVRNY